MKIIFNTTTDGAWVEVEHEDGTVKTWSEELTSFELASIQAAGMMMQTGTMLQTLLNNTDRTNKKIVKLEQALNKANEIFNSIVNIEE